jgi:glutamyl-tRNA reductase
MGDRSALSAKHVDLGRIRVRYATFREQSAPDRERFARNLADAGAAEHVLLDTCHRVELVSLEDGTPPDGTLTGTDAIRRVFEVVAGFDSAVVAEEQLLGQVRGAYEAALAAGTTGPILNELFRRALRFGRRVRSHARPGTDRSLADRGAAWLGERLAPGSTVAVAGTGEMGLRVATRLAAGGYRIVVVSASAERGGRVLEQLTGNGHRLEVGPLTSRALTGSAAISLAVRTKVPLLTDEILGGGRPWVLDLSSPAAVDPDAGARLGDRLMTLDAVGALAGAAAVLAPAVERRLRESLEREVDGFVAWLEARRGADALRVLHGEAEQVRRRHLARLRGRAALDDRQLEAVEAAATAMVGELLHGPSVELRRGGADADTVRRIFGLGR